ncbi:conjugative transposon protein TraN [Spirosoma sp. BT702]|uniref:Conjugative transposon protein TraN n=1 Tax=Spirosoma profusum TaxID=2771354 RepID=A0A926Y2T7_9BACT|nr:conjugative transposon protein TraN [Spirosoma profusum]MBD2703382.1 conjugative transposon protein TraN [Spirosoma profusum]
MKRILILLSLLAGLTAQPAVAQLAFVLPMTNSSIRPSYAIQVSTNKTTHIIFPYEIRYADLGSKEIAGEAVEKAGNVFRLKAVSQNPFLETNLTVVTADGRLFSFLLTYKDHPNALTYDLTKILLDGDVSKSARVSTGSQARLADNLNRQGELAMHSRRKIRHVGYKAMGINLYLKNILYKDDLMFLVMGIDNASKLDYAIDYLRTYVMQLKRVGESSATQDVPIDPIKEFDASERVIARHDAITKVIAIDRLTLEKDRRLIVQIGEESGGRQLSISIGPEELATARPL